MAEEAAFKISLYAKSDVGAVRPGNEDNFLVLNLSTADTWKPADHDSNAPNNLTNFNQSHYGSVVAVTDGMGGGGGVGGRGGQELGGGMRARSHAGAAGEPRVFQAAVSRATPVVDRACEPLHLPNEYEALGILGDGGDVYRYWALGDNGILRTGRR